MTLALLAFFLPDVTFDGLAWPRLRARGWNHTLYQVLRFVIVRASLFFLSGFVASLFYGVLGAVLAVLFCLLGIWTAAGDTPYHLFTDDGDLLDGEDHGHKGPILPRLAARLLGDPVQDEAEYRTGAVTGGLTLFLAALCIDAALLTFALL